MEKELPDKIKRKVQTLKDKWSTLYGLNIDKDYFIFKPLSRKEFNIVVELQNITASEAEDFIFKTCILYPNISEKDIDNMLAGTISEISRIVIEVSGFSSVEALTQTLTEYREEMELVDNQITAILCKAFSTLTPEDIDNFNFNKTMHYLALAEQMLGVTLELPKKQKTKTQESGPINFETDNKELFKTEAGNFMPKKDHNLDKLNRGNVGS